MRSLCAIAAAASLATLVSAALAAPSAPTGVAVTADETGFRVTWKDVRDDRGYQVTNGVETRSVASNSRSYFWTEDAGKYMCFRVRSVNGKRYSPWAPADGYVCATLPGMRLPWPKGTTLSIGPKALHGDNFSSIQDDPPDPGRCSS